MRNPPKYLIKLLIYSLLFIVVTSVSVHNNQAFEILDEWTPWYAVQVDGRDYQVYLDFFPSEDTFYGPVEESRHSGQEGMLQGVYVQDVLTGERVTDETIAFSAALLAQNYAITQYGTSTFPSSYWINRDANISDATIYNLWLSSDIELALPSSIDYVSQFWLRTEFLESQPVRSTYYYDIIQKMIYPTLTDSDYLLLEQQFDRDMGAIINEASQSVQKDNPKLVNGTLEYALAFLQKINELMGKDLAKMPGWTNQAVSRFSATVGQISEAFKYLFATLNILEGFTDRLVIISLKAMYIESMGQRRLLALEEMTQSSLVTIDPAFTDAVKRVREEMDSIQTNIYKIIVDAYKDTVLSVLGTMALKEIVHKLAVVAIGGSGGLAVVPAMVAWVAVEQKFYVWKAYADCWNALAIASVGKTTELSIRRELTERSRIPGYLSSIDIENSLLLSNMRFMADHLYYQSIYQAHSDERCHKYFPLTDPVYIFHLLTNIHWTYRGNWCPDCVDANAFNQYLLTESQKRLNAYTQTLPPIYWAYEDSDWFINLIRSAVPDTPPQFTSTGVTPTNSGDESTSFSFYVDYLDVDNDAPTWAEVIVNNDTANPIPLTSSDTNYRDGARFTSVGRTFPIGIHSYYISIGYEDKPLTTPSQNFYVSNSSPTIDLRMNAAQINRSGYIDPGTTIAIEGHIENITAKTAYDVEIQAKLHGNGQEVTCNQPLRLSLLGANSSWPSLPPPNVNKICDLKVPTQEGNYVIDVSVTCSNCDINPLDNSKRIDITVNSGDPYVYNYYSLNYYSYQLPVPGQTIDGTYIDYAYKFEVTGPDYTYTAWIDVYSDTRWTASIKRSDGVNCQSWNYNNPYEVNRSYYTCPDRDVLITVLYISNNQDPSSKGIEGFIGFGDDRITLSPPTQEVSIESEGTYNLVFPSSLDVRDFEYYKATNASPSSYPNALFDQKYIGSTDESIDGNRATVTMKPTGIGVQDFAIYLKPRSSTSNGYLIFGEIVGIDTPPLVNLNQPINGASTSGTVPISLTASDNGTVNSLQLYAGNTLLKSWNSAGTYTYSWDSTSYNGSTTLRAVATDNRNQTSQDSVTITLNNSRPQITNLSRTPTSPGQESIMVNADVTDTAGLSSVWLEYSTDSGANWSKTTMSNTSGSTYQGVVPAQDTGQLLYRVGANNANGSQTISDNQTVTVLDNSKPTVSNWQRIPSVIDEDYVGTVTVNVDVADKGGSGLNGAPQFEYHFGSSFTGGVAMSNIAGNTWQFVIPAQDWNALQGQSLSYRVSASDTASPVNTVTTHVQSTVIQSVNDAPTITSYTPSSSSITIPANSCVNFSIAASDEDGDLLSYKWYRSGLLQSTNSSYEYCHNEGYSDYIYVAVSDAQQSANQGWQLVIEGAPPPYSGCATVSDVSQLECEALVALYNSTDGANWTVKTNWLQTGTVCEWYGVTCNLGTVVQLALSSNNLTGDLPVEIGQLTNLSVLYLDNNQLLTLPETLINLTTLSNLWLDDNFLYRGNMSTTLQQFLDTHSPDWYLTQTVPPENFTVVDRGTDWVTLSWDSVAFPNSGYYEIGISSSDGGPYDFLTVTNDLNDTSWTITGLTADTMYHFVARTYNNSRGIASNNSVQTSVTTTGSNSGYCSSVTDVSQLECEALVALYNSADGDNWTSNTNWLQTSTVCDWYGVYCGFAGVIELRLLSNNLTGELPPEIGNLANLNYLYLNMNQITNIPAEIGKLSNLSDFQLNNNQITDIPVEIGDLSNLTLLALYGNQITSIPAEIGKLSNLTALSLDLNPITSLPSEIGNLNNLETLHLYKNQLTSLPETIIGFTNLSSLLLDYNFLYRGDMSIALQALLDTTSPDWDLTQTVPPENLKVLDRGTDWVTLGWDTVSYPNWGYYEIGISTVDGGPYDFSMVTNNLYDASWTINGLNKGTSYYVVVRTHNKFENLSSVNSTQVSVTTLGSNWVYCASVTDVSQLECDALVELYNTTDGDNWTTKTDWLQTSTVCEWYGVTCTDSAITQLNLEFNQLSGSIPVELTQLNNLQFLTLYGNQLSGSIPPDLGKLSNLKMLTLGDNQLSGSIPAELSQLSSLEYLHLGVNQLSGSIPAELGQLSSLQTLVLDGNQLSGSIPAELSQLSNLQRLILSVNQLSENIPPELGGMSSLQYILLSGNQLSGSIPSELSQLSNLQDLILAGNKLSGSVPAELGVLSSLQTLVLNENQLTSVPEALVNLVNLTQLDLDHNALNRDDMSVTLQTFLDTNNPNWDLTQTVPPEDVAVVGSDTSSVTLSWSPIAYNSGIGYYEIGVSKSDVGPYTFDVANRTANKYTTGLTVSNLTANTTYYFVIRTYSDYFGYEVTSLNGAQLSATTLGQPSPVSVLNNGGFEGAKVAGVPVGWWGKKTTNFKKDKQQCNNLALGKYVAYHGSCAFMFKGNPDGSLSKIQQNIKDTWGFTNGSTVEFSVYVDKRSANVGHTIGKLVIQYSNNTSDKLVLKIPSSYGYTLVSDSIVLNLTGRSISKVKVQFRNRLRTGKFLIDDASLTVTPTPAISVNQRNSDILPLPDIPNGFRD